MLTGLRIENILLMDKTTIRFDEGFSVITGQTGAGKSILLDSLNIILGERAGTAILRNPDNHGVIVATFDIDNPELLETLANGGFISSGDRTIIIKKIITKNGSKIFINDIQTTIQFVGAISHYLVEIYSQFEQTDLFSIKKHLEILDKFGNLDTSLQKMRTLYIQMQNAQEKYDKTRLEIERQKENAEYLQSFVDDVLALNLVSGEYDELVNRKKTMTDISKVATYISRANGLFGETKLGSVINKVQNDLLHAQGDIGEGGLNKEIDNINDLLEKLYNDYQIAGETLNDLAERNHFDEGELNDIEERIACINEVARKYQTTPMELSNQFVLAQEKLQKIELSDEVLQKLSSELENIRNNYYTYANELREQRKAKAKILEQIVLEKLAALKMDKVIFYTSFEDAEPTAYGIDKVVFFASMNPGLTPAPIHKIASGGELSRFMLAFKSALCTSQTASTMIFDEIDTGVSGSVAFAIGREMQKLAQTTQLICITHNSQTAACARHHLFVAKEQTLEDTKTIVKTLSPDERVRVIAEMISSDEITDEAVNNARRLIEKANE